MNNILVPRNIEGRKEKLHQMNIQLLSQEVIEGDLVIDKSFEGIPEEFIKVKEIKGNVWLEIKKGYIPLWLKVVKIYGDFYCVNNYLKSLDNCPQYVGKRFSCSHNELTSLEGCPQYVGGNFYCRQNIKILHLTKLIQLKGKFINKLYE